MSFVAYTMQRTLELELERKGIEYSHEKISEAIKNMEYIELKTQNQTFVVRTKINELGQKILKTLDIPIPKIITPSQEFETKLKMQ
jgi:hypothetical protein